MYKLIEKAKLISPKPTSTFANCPQPIKKNLFYTKGKAE